jgi:hypothetical protein
MQPLSVSDKEVDVLEELCAEFPFFALPFELLAKIYKEKQSYKYDKCLKKASLRCKDRTALYQYIHPSIEQEQPLGQEQSNEQEPSIEQEQPVVIEQNFAQDPPLEQIEVTLTPEFIHEETAIDKETNEISELAEDLISIDTHAPLAEEEMEKEESVLPSPMLDIESPTALSFTDWLQQFGNPSQTNKGVEEITTPKKKAVHDFLSITTQKEEKVVDTKKETKGLSTEIRAAKVEKTMEVIDSFLKTNPVISHPKTEFFKAEKAAKKSLELNATIVTETLAKIYVKQGHIEQAIWAYEKLSLKFPQKETYFANLIKELKNKE